MPNSLNTVREHYTKTQANAATYTKATSLRPVNEIFFQSILIQSINYMNQKKFTSHLRATHEYMMFKRDT